jgi:hypothetical protein
VLAPGEQVAGTRTVELELTTLDNELRRLNMRPAYIKIDVEGQDLNALKGALDTLRSGCVRLVKFEHNEGEPLPPIMELFASLGWTVFTLDRRGRITDDARLIATNMNLMAAPPDVLAMLKKG